MVVANKGRRHQWLHFGDLFQARVAMEKEEEGGVNTRWVAVMSKGEEVTLAFILQGGFRVATLEIKLN